MGIIQRYKARLVAKGFAQSYMVDYFKTFSLVAMLNTVMVILSIAANFQWPLYQLDIKNAFLHGDLQEVYMKVYLGFVPKVQGDEVCRLKRHFTN